MTTFSPGTPKGVMRRINKRIYGSSPRPKGGSAMSGPSIAGPGGQLAGLLYGTRMKKGGTVKESKEMAKKEVSFMKKKGAPKSMIKHEKAEAGMEAGGVTKKLPTAKQMGSLGMKHGGKVKKFDGGGMAYPRQNPRPGVAPFKGGITKKMAAGGLAAGHKTADGVAKKGKTDTKMVAMKKGGGVKKMAKGGRYC